MDELATAIITCEADIAALADDTALATAETVARDAAEAARAALGDAMQAESQLANLIANAEQRQTSCATEAAQWQQRLNGLLGAFRA